MMSPLGFEDDRGISAINCDAVEVGCADVDTGDKQTIIIRIKRIW